MSLVLLSSFSRTYIKKGRRRTIASALRLPLHSHPRHLYTRKQASRLPRGAAGLGGSGHARLFIACPCSIKLNLASTQEGSHPWWWEGACRAGQLGLSNTTLPGSENASHRSCKKRNGFEVLPRQCKMGYSSSPGRIRVLQN